MKNNTKLIFSKHVITELNDTEVSKVNGGTLSPNQVTSCSFCINSSNGTIDDIIGGGPFISINQ